ncbi:MAG: aspartyl-phosphate phosphatase Spo0E family protein [Paenisporosarcina sp.]
MKLISLNKRSVTVMQINIKKIEMMQKAKRYGRTHPSVVKCSQQLDVLLNQYQGIHVYNRVV